MSPLPVYYDRTLAEQTAATCGLDVYFTVHAMASLDKIARGEGSVLTPGGRQSTLYGLAAAAHMVEYPTSVIIKTMRMFADIQADTRRVNPDFIDAVPDPTDRKQVTEWARAMARDWSAPLMADGITYMDEWVDTCSDAEFARLMTDQYDPDDQQWDMLGERWDV